MTNNNNNTNTLVTQAELERAELALSRMALPQIVWSFEHTLVCHSASWYSCPRQETLWIGVRPGSIRA